MYEYVYLIAALCCGAFRKVFRIAFRKAFCGSLAPPSQRPGTLERLLVKGFTKCYGKGFAKALRKTTTIKCINT